MSWAGKIFFGLVHKETKLQTPDFGTVCICYSKVSKIFVFLFLREKVRKINYFAQQGYIRLFNMYNVTENLFQINLTYYWSKNIEFSIYLFKVYACLAGILNCIYVFSVYFAFLWSHPFLLIPHFISFSQSFSFCD